MLRRRFDEGEHTIWLLLHDPFGGFSMDNMHIGVALGVDRNKADIGECSALSISWGGKAAQGIYPLSIVLPYAGDADVNIYNIMGERITTIFSGKLSDREIIYWDGKNESGEIQPTGIYFATVHFADMISSCKIIRMK